VSSSWSFIWPAQTVAKNAKALRFAIRTKSRVRSGPASQARSLPERSAKLRDFDALLIPPPPLPVALKRKIPRHDGGSGG
jgi:hypothetical protein